MISDIEANPETPPDVFRYHPVAADSKASEGKAEPAKPSDYKPVSLAGITKGKATLLTLWAPWCGPCIGEFAAFQAALDRHPGQFQIVALGVQDSRLNIVNYIPGEGIPRNVWIDPQGRIVEYHNGGYEAKEISEKVDRWVDLLR